MLHVRPRRGAVATVGGSCFVADLLKPFVVGEEQLKKTWRFVLRWRGVVEEDSEIRSSPIYSNQVRCFRFVVGGSSVRRCFRFAIVAHLRRCTAQRRQSFLPLRRCRRSSGGCRRGSR
nr:hypothetical protein Iba_chr04fCG11240 [Ipomoea batatas]